MAGTEPLRLYVYREGLARFATVKYSSPNAENIEDICMHLTNYAVNKDNPNFVFNKNIDRVDVGHKRTMSSVFNLMKNMVPINL